MTGLHLAGEKGTSVLRHLGIWALKAFSVLPTLDTRAVGVASEKGGILGAWVRK